MCAVVWLDFGATRAELLALLGDQAASLRQTLAAAARSNQEAGKLSEAQMAARLLDNARLLGELDRRGALSEALLDEIVERHRLFRVGVFSADGSLERASAAGGRPRQPRGLGGGTGQGLARSLIAGGAPEATSGLHEARGRTGGGARLSAGGAPEATSGVHEARGRTGGGARLSAGGAPEATSGVHEARGRTGGGARLSAGVRRSGGGAIVLNVDASSVAELQRHASLDALLSDITTSADDVAYVVFEREGLRLSHGATPEDRPWPESPAPHGMVSRAVAVGDDEALEFEGPIDLGGEVPARLRLGMRLDGVQRAQRRMLVRLALSLLATLGLGGLGLGLVWLRQRYGALSEQHARAEEALRRRDRLAAMGELSSTVAHEIRNPLNALGMSAQRLRREFLKADPLTEGEQGELEDLLGVVQGETQRINRIVQQFLDFARPPHLSPSPSGLGELVAGVAEGMRALAASRGVSLECDVKGAGEANLDPDQLRQALDNVVRNAVAATPEGGRVTLVAHSGPEGHSIEVSDTGCGIAPNDLHRIFDLYFTTRTEGTGVGLAVAQQIVTAHGGRIEVESQPQEGTRMTLRLPRIVPEVGRG